MLNFKILLSLALFLAAPANAYFLDHFKLQHAGEIGEIALGVGKRFNEVYSLDYLHGFVREETGGTSIVTVALKNNFDLFHFDYNGNYADLYSGVSIFHVTGLRYQASRRNNFPGSYYSIGSLRGLLFIGAKGWIDQSSPHQAYFEAGINDLWLINYANNSEAIDAYDYVSLALGYNYLF